MRSEYGVDSAVQGAAERGCCVTLVAGTDSTFDGPVAKAGEIIAIQNDSLSGSFAKLARAAEVEF